MKIKVVLPLACKMAPFGKDQQCMLLLVEQKVNDSCGINSRQLKFLFEDSTAVLD